jgi:hypothetical protein
MIIFFAWPLVLVVSHNFFFLLKLPPPDGRNCTSSGGKQGCGVGTKISDSFIKAQYVLIMVNLLKW